MAQVLIVEDEAALRHMVARNLERRGHDVVKAESDAEAEAAMRVRIQRWDLILLDVNLPDATGWDVLRHMQDSAEPAPKIIVMTAVRPAQSRISTFHPDAVLLKPFPIEALLRLVERLLGESQVENAP